MDEFLGAKYLPITHELLYYLLTPVSFPIEFLDCSMQKSSVWGIQGQPHGMKDRVAELKDQLILETAIVLESKIELSQTKLEQEMVLKLQWNQLNALGVSR